MHHQIAGDAPTPQRSRGQNVAGGGRRIGAPQGRVSTFDLGVVDATADHADFSFVSPRVLVGTTVFNNSNADMTLKIDSLPNQVIAVTIPAGQSQRIQTEWHASTSRIRREVMNGTTLCSWKFDDIRYGELARLHPSSSRDTDSRVRFPRMGRHDVGSGNCLRNPGGLR